MQFSKRVGDESSQLIIAQIPESSKESNKELIASEDDVAASYINFHSLPIN